MKQSILIRFAITALILCGWAYNMFPLTTKEDSFWQEVRKSADKTIKKNTLSEEKIKALKEAYTAAAQASYQAPRNFELKKTSDLAKEKLDKAISQKEVEIFDKVLEAAKKSEGTKMTPDSPVNMTKPVALAEEARKGGIKLSKFIATPGESSPSNERVARRLQKRIEGKLKKGLDIAGGVEFVIGFDPTKIKDADMTVQDARDRIIQVLQGRIDSKGLAEAELRPFGESAVMIRMPAVSDEEIEGIRNLLTRQASLTFRGVHPDRPYGPAEVTDINYELVRMKDLDAKPMLLKITPEMGGENIQDAYPSRGEQGDVTVGFEFNNTGATQFAKVTGEYLKKPLAIVLDGVCYSAPTIQSIISSRGSISGDFTLEDAEELSIVLKSGALPVQISIKSESKTAPTLGEEAVSAGLWAAIIGLACVFLGMLLYYRTAGLVADLALLANILLVFGTMAIWKATFTLPGIAGIILTIGMAVDANVLIYERIREELASSKCAVTAVKNGFGRAFVTILDANLTTLLTAWVLFMFGTGPVKGFATTLAIGIIASMFTALFVSRIFFDWFIENQKDSIIQNSFKEKSKFKVNFWVTRPKAFVLSSIVILIAIGGMISKGSDGYNVDFTGGLNLTYQVNGESPEVAQIVKALEEANFKGPIVNLKKSQLSEHAHLDVLVKETREDFDAFKADQDTSNFYTFIDKTIGASDATFIRIQQESVDPIVGKEFKKMAAYSIVISIIFIFLYISFRFESTFAVGAIAALTHDTIIALGLFILAGGQVSMPVVAAILTIIGYSLNDTIVVFDRIRENSAHIKDGTIISLMNNSINETLGRTILTSTTTGVVVLMLCVLGGGAVADFAFVLLTGVIVGTYSSIFVAAPIVCNSKLSSQLETLEQEKLEKQIRNANDLTILTEEDENSISAE